LRGLLHQPYKPTRIPGFARVSLSSPCPSSLALRPRLFGHLPTYNPTNDPPGYLRRSRALPLKKEEPRVTSPGLTRRTMKATKHPHAEMVPRDLERFHRHTATASSGCLEWTGRRDKDGYGRFWLADRMEQAHRVSWRLHSGAIPVGLSVLHSCDNPPCVNPAHLFLGTQADNVGDMIQKGRRVAYRKITRPVATEIRKMAVRGDMTQAAVGAVFGLRQQMVSASVHNHYWKEGA